MNSGTSDTNPAPASPSLSLRQIRILTAIWVLLLIAVGIASAWKEVEGLFLSIDITFLLAIVYALAVFRYGSVFFGNADPALRARAWSRWTWIAAALYTVPFPAGFVFLLLYDEEMQAVAKASIILVALKFIVCVLPPLLWAWIGNIALLRQTAPTERTASSSSTKLGLSLLVGTALVLSSLILHVGYSTPGWQVLSWRRYWVTNDFILVSAMRPWLNGLALASYAAAILLALASAVVGAMAMAKKTLAPKPRALLLDLSVIVLWSTLTNHFGNLLYVDFLGVFLLWPSCVDVARSVMITAAWPIMFVLGTVLWFRFRRRTDDRARAVNTALVLWALPLMLVSVASSWFPAAFEIYGLVAFVFGVQILAACYWKMARSPQPAS